MASQVPPKRGEAFSFEIGLVSQDDTDIFQTSVTLAAGDVVVYQDGVLDGNIDTLPVEIGTSGLLTVSLSVDEMTADRITVLFHDVTGDEWQDMSVTIHTVTNLQIDDLLASTTVIEGFYTVSEVLQLCAAVLFGKVSGGGTTTVTFRNTGDTADRVTAVVDSDGNRSAVTLNV